MHGLFWLAMSVIIVESFLVLALRQESLRHPYLL